MSEEGTAVEAGPSVEDRAKEMGWVPAEEFKGDKERFIPADEYVRRGEQYIPFLQARERKLQGEVAELRTSLREAQQLGRANAAAVAEIKATQTEIVKDAVAEQLDGLRAQLKQARLDNDFDREETLREQIDDLKAKQRAPAAQPVNGSATNFNDHPDWKAWVAENPWWNEDTVLRAAAVGVSEQLARTGVITDAMPYSARLAKVSEVMKSRFGVGKNERREEPPSVEGSRGGSSSNTGPKGYGDLPREAKEACDSFAARLVGKGKRYENITAWRKDYAAKFFAEA